MAGIKFDFPEGGFGFLQAPLREELRSAFKLGPQPEQFCATITLSAEQEKYLLAALEYAKETLLLDSANVGDSLIEQLRLK